MTTDLMQHLAIIAIGLSIILLNVMLWKYRQQDLGLQEIRDLLRQIRDKLP